jgi:hypothetical protein
MARQFDRIVCDYPLPGSDDQDREFLTRDLGTRGVDRYTITRDGRLIRHASPTLFGPVPVHDIEWPIHDDIRIFAPDSTADGGAVEYAVRFTRGRVEWIRRVVLEGDATGPAARVAWRARGAPIPAAMGRPATPEEFRACAPRTLELLDGRVPGEEKLVLLLLSTIGLRRVAALVGREAWLEGVDL